MKDKYIRNVTISALDREITAIVKKATNSELGGGPMVIAVKNENDQVYRVVTTKGLNTYLIVVNGLTALGLVDLHANNLRPGEYDSLFVLQK